MNRHSVIDLVLLKTRSQPKDTYAEYFAAASTSSQSSSPNLKHDEANEFYFNIVFVPVLEHKQDAGALSKLGDLLITGRLKDVYGGMIFTSQRAVEGWAEVVSNVEKESAVSQTKTNNIFSHDATSSEDGLKLQQETATVGGDQAIDERTNRPFTTDIRSLTEFPLYTVGPATSRALTALVTSRETSTSIPKSSSDSEDADTNHSLSSPFLTLNPTVLGAHTGNGASLAAYILQHYNDLQAQKWFTFYEAPRLPFIPIIGMGSENYSRKRLESTDPRLAKKPLLFLVGEQRRDIIPKTLMDYEKLGAETAINVEEVEVYSTIVRDGFRNEFDDMVRRWSNTSETTNEAMSTSEGIPAPTSTLPGAGTEAGQPYSIRSKIVVIVVFSPQGTRDLLQSIGFLNDEGTLNQDKIASRWQTSVKTNTSDSNTHSQAQSQTQPQMPVPTDQWNIHASEPKYIIVTIGPTTRDFLRKTYSFEADICATKPSPQGIWDGIQEFMRGKGSLL